MPRCLDPGSDFPLWLDSDADKPADERPTFVCKYLTVREWERAIEDKGSIAKTILAAGVVGWRNMRSRDGSEIPFSSDALLDVLSPTEDVELLEKLTVSYDVKKKSPLLQPSTAVSSVLSADPESA